jgi:SOS-response transcriptional repressor LexA
MVRHFRRLAGYLGASELRERVDRDPSWFAAAGVGRPTRRPGFRVLSFRPEERYVRCVPLAMLKAAAGAFGDPQYLEDGEWVEVDTHRKLRPGMFVAQVVGRSMEPSIPDGAYCLFSGPVTGSRQGRTVLVQLRDEVDPETGERFTVKRYESEKGEIDDGGWRHLTITLRPTNPELPPIEIVADDEERVQVIAELLEIVATG